MIQGTIAAMAARPAMPIPIPIPTWAPIGSPPELLEDDAVLVEIGVEVADVVDVMVCASDVKVCVVLVDVEAAVLVWLTVDRETVVCETGEDVRWATS